jgi:hypothetical protein
MGTVASFLPLKPVVDSIAVALSPPAEPTNWSGLAVTSGWLVFCALFVLWRSRRVAAAA